MSDLTSQRSPRWKNATRARRFALAMLFGVTGAAGIAWFSGVDLLAQERPSGSDRSSRDSGRSSGGSSGSSRFGSGSSGSSRFGSRGPSGSSTGGERPSFGGERPSFGGERPSFGGSSGERPSFGGSPGERPSFGSSGMGTTRPSMQPGSFTPPAYTPTPKPERSSERPSESFGSGGVASSGGSHKTTFPIPPSKPMSPQYEALLQRSMFIRGKQDTVVRPQLAEQPRPAAEVVAPPVYRPEQYLLLTGVVEERDAATGELVGQAAQVENTQTFTRERVLIGGVVGRGIVKDISVAGVQFELEGQTTTIVPGFFFDGHAAPPPGSSSVIAMTPPPIAAPAIAAAPTTSPTTVPAEGTVTAAAPTTQPSEGGVAATPTTGAAPTAAPGGPAPGSPEAIAEMMRRRRQEQGGN